MSGPLFARRGLIYSWDDSFVSWAAKVREAGGSVSSHRAFLVNDLVVKLKASGIWAGLDRLWLFAAENSQSALRDIVSASLATLTSAPTFTADRGYTTDGAASYIDTTFNPTTGSPKYTQNSCTWSILSRTSGQTASSGNGIFVGGTGTTIGLRGTTDLVSERVNQAASITAANADGSGLFTGSRTGAGTVNVYRNATSILSDTTTSEAVVNATFQVGHTNSAASFSAREWAAAAIGAGRNGSAEMSFYNALQAYMTAVGA